MKLSAEGPAVVFVVFFALYGLVAVVMDLLAVMA